jgi:predicted membrane chloride channel (bestrophin family)
MESIILQNLPWVWIIVGGILMSLELILPGMFIFFVGFSLVVTGLLSFCIPMTITIQMVVFSIISIISVLIGSAFLKKFFPSDVSRGGLIKDDFNHLTKSIRKKLHKLYLAQLKKHFVRLDKHLLDH